MSGPYQFYSAVKDGGAWDYKRRPDGTDWIPFNGEFQVLGKTMTAEQLGNLNYGFTGAATHFPASVLHMAGGIVAIKNNGINWSDWWYDFDSKEDYEMIQAGINIYYLVWWGYSIEDAFKEVWK